MTHKQQSTVFWLGALLFVVAYVFWLDAPFYLDDYTSIFERPAITNSQSLIAFFNATPISRILVDVSFYLNYEIAGVSPSGFRLVNVGIHALNSVLVFYLVKKLAPEPNFAKAAGLTAALVFLLHPLNTQAVTYVVQRYTEVSIFFVLVGALLAAKVVTQRSRPTLWMALAWLGCLLAAFFSKQSGLILLPVTFAIGVFGYRQWLSEKKVWLALLVLSSIAAVLLNLEPINSLTREASDVSRLDYFLSQGPVIWMYWFKLVVPFGLHLESDVGVGSFPLWLSFLAWIGHAAVIVGGINLTLRGSLIGLGLLIMYAGQTIESTVIPITDFYFEHRAYLSTIGFAVIAADLISKIKATRYQLWVVTLIVVILSALTYYRNYQWANPVQFYENEEVYAPDSHRVKNELARHYVVKQEYKTAAKRYAAIMNNPDIPKTESIVVNSMVAFYHVGRSDLVTQLANSVNEVMGQFKPNSKARIYRLLGQVAYDRGNYTQAVDKLQVTLSFFPKDRLTLSKLAQSYVQLARYEEANAVIERLSDIDDTFYREARFLYCNKTGGC